MPETVRVLRFIFILCSFCASLLACLSLLLDKPQKRAQELNQNRELLIAAKILSADGYFLTQAKGGIFLPAKWDPTTGELLPSIEKIPAKQEEILTLYKQMIHPLLVDKEGNLITFEEANLDYSTYYLSYQKQGYQNLPLKLIFEIKKNQSPPQGYVIPITGYGLWDAIYGYLAIEKDGNHVLGTTWYEHKETAGLGANIAYPAWQAQFAGKTLFPIKSNGAIDQDAAPGLFVIKGRVVDLPKNSPKISRAIDGISGATMTGKGVTHAYQDSLSPYKPFLLKLQKSSSP